MNKSMYIVPAKIYNEYQIPAIYWSNYIIDNNIEIWVPITENNVHGIEPYRYIVSNLGRIYDYKYEKFVNPFYTTGGYLRVSLNNNIKVMLHRLVLGCFTNRSVSINDNEYQVNHLDSTPSNNKCVNLMWCTASENTQYAYMFGNAKVGEECVNTILTNEQVHQICKLLQESQLSYSQIGEMFNVNESYINHIAHGETWKSISRSYNINKRVNDYMKDEDVHYICAEFEKGNFNYQEIADILNFKYNSKFKRKLDAIRYGENFKYISENYNIPKINRSPFTVEEKEFIMNCFDSMGANISTYRYICDILGIEFDNKIKNSLNSIKYGNAYKNRNI